MSDASTNVSSASATSSTAAGATNSASPGDASQQSAANSDGQAGKTAQNSENQDSGLEEIKIGSTTAKVSKEIAAVIKNLERGMQTKAQEAANTKKLLSLAKENPKEFFKQTGKDAHEFAEQILAEKYELMALTPEQRRLRELEAQNTERDNQEKSSKMEIINEIKKRFGGIPDGAENATKEQLINYFRHQQQVQVQTQASLDNDMGAAFKESGLPVDKHLLATVAFRMRTALAQNKTLSAKEAVAKVKQEYFAGAKQTLNSMDMESVHRELGDEFFDKLRKWDLDRVTASAVSKFGQQNQGQGNQPSSQATQKKYLTEAEWSKKYRG